MTTSARAIAVALGIGWLNLLTIQSFDLDPEQTLQMLRERDRAFWYNYSLTLSVEALDFWRQPVSYRLRTTSNQTTTIVIRDQAYYPSHPTYSTLVEWYKEGSHIGPCSDSLSLPYTRWTNTWYLQDQKKKLYAEAEQREVVFISSENAVRSVRSASHPSLIIHRSSNCSSYNWSKFGLNALGRGFSQYLDKALLVKELPGGQLELWATDKRVVGNRWRLVIDPSRQFLVVEAELINSEGRVRDQYQNEGTVEAPIPLAKRGTMRWYDWSDNNAIPEMSRFECVSYEARFRTDWYEEVKRIIHRPPPGTQVMDERVEPPTTFTVK